MRPRAIFVLILCTLLAGCGGGHRAATKTTGTQTLRLWFLRGNELAPVQVSVPATPAVATAALQRLLAGPPSGYRTAIPRGTRLERIAVSGGRASVLLSADRLTHSAEGQIVYTLTQFATVTSVDGGPFAAPEGRTDFTDLTSRSPIFVARPVRDSAVSSPVRASGSADVFEGTFAVDVWSGGRRVRTQTIQATSGTGTRGTWSASIRVPSGPAKLVFYEPSAEDGTPLHATTVLLTVR
jgi:immunoglobulin-like protein involved in spore germination/sporulation and spore germination protein